MGIIRFLLACSVLIAHCKLSFGAKLFPGNMAVEMFFMISGFYMSLILSGKYETATWAGRFDFYLSRFWRLWPTFILTTIAAYFWWLVEYWYIGREPTSAGDFRGMIGNDLIYYAVQTSNLFMVGQDIPSIFHVSQSQGVHLTFGPAVSSDGNLWMGFMRPIGQAWSIGTEIWFYLLAPLLCRLATPWLLAIITASLALRIAMDTNGLIVYFFFPTQLALFIFGVIAQRHLYLSPRSVPVISSFGLALIVTAAIAFGLGLNQTWKWPLYAVFAFTMASIFHRFQRSAMDRVIGELSYPIYITHTFLLSVLGAIGKHAGVEIGGEALLPVVVVASWLLYKLVDQPIGHWRERFRKLPSTQYALREPAEAQGEVDSMIELRRSQDRLSS